MQAHLRGPPRHTGAQSSSSSSAWLLVMLLRSSYHCGGRLVRVEARAVLLVLAVVAVMVTVGNFLARKVFDTYRTATPRPTACWAAASLTTSPARTVLGHMSARPNRQSPTCPGGSRSPARPRWRSGHLLAWARLGGSFTTNGSSMCCLRWRSRRPPQWQGWCSEVDHERGAVSAAADAPGRAGVRLEGLRRNGRYTT